jgi:hypothetical protein
MVYFSKIEFAKKSLSFSSKSEFCKSLVKMNIFAIHKQIKELGFSNENCIELRVEKTTPMSYGEP